jgi:hypothetical protein
MEVARPFRFELDDQTPRVSIFAKLREKYEALLRKDIHDVYIAQSRSGIFLEVRRHPYNDPKREVVDYVDLDVLGNFLSERVEVSRNAEKFLALDDFSLVNVTDLFEKEAANAIWDKHAGT